MTQRVNVDRAWLEAAYAEHKSAPKIASLVGCSVVTIYRLMVRLGISRRPRGNTIDFLGEKRTIYSIAKEYGISYATVRYRWLCGLKGLDLVSTPRKYTNRRKG